MSLNHTELVHLTQCTVAGFLVLVLYRSGPLVLVLYRSGRSLILVWTEPRAGLYHALHIIRKKLVLQGAVKKSLITARIRTGTEVLTEANRQLEQQLEEQAKEIKEKDKEINEKAKEITEKDKELKELKTQLAKRQSLEKR